MSKNRKRRIQFSRWLSSVQFFVVQFYPGNVVSSHLWLLSAGLGNVLFCQRLIMAQTHEIKVWNTDNVLFPLENVISFWREYFWSFKYFLVARRFWTNLNLSCFQAFSKNQDGVALLVLVGTQPLGKIYPIHQSCCKFVINHAILDSFGFRISYTCIHYLVSVALL